MLYLNLKFTSQNGHSPYLTLTNVVFELMKLMFITYICTNLTLTNVVFEFMKQEDIDL